MRSFFATLRQLVIPAGAQPGTPRIVIGPNVPAALTTTFFTPTAAIIWYFDATRYYFIAVGMDTSGGPPAPLVLAGTQDPVVGLTIMNQYAPSISSMAFGTSTHDLNTLTIHLIDSSLNIQSSSDVQVQAGATIFLNSGSDLRYAGESILNWQTYVPGAIGTMNFGVGATVNGQYVRIGQTYLFEATITLGPGFAIGDAAISLPATPSAGITYELGAAPLTDTSTGQTYFGRVRRFSTGMRFEYINNLGQYQVITAAAPFAFAAGDVLRVNAQFHI